MEQQDQINPQNNVPPAPPNPYTNVPVAPTNPQPPGPQIVQPFNPSQPQMAQPNIQTPVNLAFSGAQKPPETPEKKKFEKNKKIAIFGMIGFVVFLVIMLFVVLVFGKGPEKPNDSIKLTKNYDSPIGIAAPFQTSDVKNGKFKLTANYLNGADFSREGNFYVEDGQVFFEMITDTPKVNDLIKNLYIKQGKQTDYTDKNQGATKNFKYDFTSLLGYNYLNDVNLAEGFIPQVEAARDNPESATKTKKFNIGRDCNAALSELKGKINQNMQINNGLNMELLQEGIRTKGVVSFNTRQSVDNSIIRFLENCYDQKQKDASFYKEFTASLRNSVTTSPTFTTWEQGGKYYVEIRDQPKDAPFSGNLKFELSDFNTLKSSKTGETASYADRRNEYGLAYSLCRVEPISKTDIPTGYRLVIEDTAYTFPEQSHTGYYCTTPNVPAEYAIASKMTLKLDNALIKQVDPAKQPGLKILHDLEYQAEKYMQDNKRYPNKSEFIDLANNNLGALTVEAQALLKSGIIQYIASPDQCVGDCSGYKLTYKYLPNFILSRYPY